MISLIVFTKFYDVRRGNVDGGTLARVLGYVKSKTTYTDEKYKGLLWGTGRTTTLKDLETMERLFQNSEVIRMIVFSPVRWLEAPFLDKYTRKTMWQFMKNKNYLSMVFAYGLHYNTSHPHAHVITASFFEKENRFSRGDIYTLQRVAHHIFEEPIGKAAYDVYPNTAPSPPTTNEKATAKKGFEKPDEQYERLLKQKVMEVKDEFELEYRDASEFDKVANIEDVYEMEI